MLKTKRDCFAYKDGGCNALTCLYCKDKSCRFYKSKQQQKEQLKQCAERLMSIGNTDAANAIHKQIAEI